MLVNSFTQTDGKNVKIYKWRAMALQNLSDKKFFDTIKVFVLIFCLFSKKWTDFLYIWS